MVNWNVPFVGEVDRNWVLLGGAGTAGIIGVMYYRNARKKRMQDSNKPSEVFVAGQIGTDPAGNTGPIDPETGYVYGSPEDLEVLGEHAVEQYADVDYYRTQYVPITSREHRGGNGDRDKGSRDKDEHKGRETNEQWKREAVSALKEEFPNIENVLTKVLAGQAVTSAEKDEFMDVVQIEGPPPQGYPKPIKLLDNRQHVPHKPRNPRGVK